jgi:PKD domain/S-layer homology domain
MTFTPRLQTALRVATALLCAVVVAFLLPAGAAWGQTSTQRNPTATFSTPGAKQVTLTACKASGCTSVTKTVVVLDPKPNIVSASLPSVVGMGQAVSLRATATGRPPMTYEWTFSNGTDSVVTGNPSVWNAPSSPGTFLASLKVINADGVASTVPVTVTVVPSAFTDVPPSHWAWRFIENLYTRGVSTTCGTDPLRYCPEDAMTRGDMAIFLLRAKEGSAYVPPACVTPAFSDVPCSDSRSPWINELVRRGVTAGCGGGFYCPDSPVTREQMAVFLLVTKEGAGYHPGYTCLSPPFTDVPCYSPFAPWVRELVARGVTAGCGGGAYCPTLTVTRAQMSVFISTMFNLPPP